LIYADTATMPRFALYALGVQIDWGSATRHSYRVSRNASTLSGGW